MRIVNGPSAVARPRMIHRLVPASECIMEERLWIHGVEFVSHVNYTQLGRIRASRGLPLPALDEAGEWPPPLGDRQPFWPEQVARSA